MIDIFDVVAGPKPKGPAPQKDKTQAAEDQTSFADELAAQDESEPRPKNAEASIAKETDAQTTSTASATETEQKTDPELAQTTDKAEASFNVLSQANAEEAAELTAKNAETPSTGKAIGAETKTSESVTTLETAKPDVDADKALAVQETKAPDVKNTAQLTDNEAVPEPTLGVNSKEATDSKAAKAAAEQPTVAPAVAAQAQKTAGEAATEKPVPAVTPGEATGSGLKATNATADPDDIANAKTLTGAGTAVGDQLQTFAGSTNGATATEATGTSVLTATTQATSAAPTQSANIQIAQTPSTITTPPNVVAVPEDIPRLITQAMTSEDAADRIIIQLDPPELGRVSVDFKIDANGVQTVTVTAETPEAIKKLRMMNFELIQAMEQNGLNSDGFGLDYQQSQQFTQYQSDPAYADGDSEAVDTDSMMRLTETALYRNPQAGQAGLNLKL
ncbi:MAG: flagellar hook-length control protein FliK [Pseudomonadota bacterium]